MMMAMCKPTMLSPSYSVPTPEHSEDSAQRVASTLARDWREYPMLMSHSRQSVYSAEELEMQVLSPLIFNSMFQTVCRKSLKPATSSGVMPSTFSSCERQESLVPLTTILSRLSSVIWEQQTWSWQATSSMREYWRRMSFRWSVLLTTEKNASAQSEREQKGKEELPSSSCRQIVEKTCSWMRVCLSWMDTIRRAWQVQRAMSSRCNTNFQGKRLNLTYFSNGERVIFSMKSISIRLSLCSFIYLSIKQLLRQQMHKTISFRWRKYHNYHSSSQFQGYSLIPCISAFNYSSMRLCLAPRTPCSSRLSLLGMKGRVSPRHISLLSSQSTNWSTQVSSYLPMLFLTRSFRLSTQKGSKISKTRGGLRVSLRQRRARAFRYLQSFYPRQTRTMSSVRPICSILKRRQRNLVGFFAPPQSPPVDLRSNALSMNVSALRAKHSSFQQRLLNILLREVLSISCVPFFSIDHYLLQTTPFRFQMEAIKPLRLSASIILSLGDASGENNRFLMLVRKPHMSFENSLVFPGGTCDKEDEVYSREFLNFAKTTAVRELIQETGILLLPPQSKIQDLAALRVLYKVRKLQHLNALLLSFWQKELHLIQPIARFITPQFPKMSRFDCLFLIVLPGVQRVNLGPSDSLMELSIHIEESSRYFWATPEQYLQMLLEGQIFLPPPQRLLLHYLGSVGSDVYKIRLTVEPMLGQFNQQMQFILPGDKAYNYELFFQLQPKSRLSDQLKEFMRIKQQNTKQDHICRISNITPVKQKTILKSLQLFLHPNQKTTILSFIKLPSSQMHSKL